MVLIAQKKDILEIKWRRVSDMPDLSKLEKPLRSRFRLIPSIPVMVRVSLAGVSDILDFIQTLLTAFSSYRENVAAQGSSGTLFSDVNGASAYGPTSEW